MEISEKNTKLKIIKKLLVTKELCQKLHISLLYTGETEKADKVKKKATKLSDSIDDLLGHLMGEWRGESQKIIAGTINVNASLEKAINEIEHDIKIAENVVKAIGYIDDAVEIAVKIAEKL